MSVKYKAFAFSFVALLFLYQTSFLLRTLISFVSNLVVLAVLAWELGPFVTSSLLKPFTSRVNPKNKAILITGCDSGFGHGTALLLNKLGFKVYAGCLMPDQAGPKSLKENATEPERMLIFKMDVTKDEDIDFAYSFVQSTLKDNEKLWALVNNAGILRMGPIELGEFDYFVSDQFKVNVFAVVKVTRKFSPLIRQAKGRVVVLSSVASRISLSPLAAYCMTKHAVTAFCDCLRIEVAKSGVSVTSIEPYFYDTRLVSSSHLNNLDDRCWKSSTDEMKKSFGEANYKKMILDFLRLLQLQVIGANQNPQQVIQAVATALTDSEPQYRYVCCSILLKPLILMGNLVPREIFLFVFNKMYKLAAYHENSRRKVHKD